MAKKNYEEMSSQILALVGGKENLAQLAHCVTRLRIAVKDKGLVQDDKIIYFIVDEIYFQAKVPWYINYNDLCNLLASAPEFADFGAAANLEVSEMFASAVARPKGQTETFLRTVLKSAKDVKTTEAEYVGMKNVYSTVSGTMNRIAGNYFEPAVEGALVQPSKQIDDIQRILRT